MWPDFSPAISASSSTKAPRAVSPRWRPASWWRAGPHSAIFASPPCPAHAWRGHRWSLICWRLVRGLLSGGDRTAWLGSEDSNSEMSPQNIPLKRRADFRRFSRIWQSETIRARAAKPGHTADAAVEVSLRDKQGGFEPVCIHHFRKFRAMSGARPLRLKYSDAAEMLAQQPVCANRDRTQRSKIRGHSITASASASSLCGTSRPSALAVVPACDLP